MSLLLLLASLWLAAAAPVVQLHFDLQESALTIVRDGSAERVDLAAGLDARWESWIAQLAAGRWNAEDARALGRELFPAAAASLLHDAARWQFADASMVGLDAVIPPWSTDQPLLLQARLEFQTRSSGPAPLAVDGVLFLAPFVTERFDALDSPDTFEAAWPVALRHFQKLPRNDVDPPLLRETLQRASSSILHLRALDEWPRGWAQQWDAAPPLRVWSWPGRAQGCDSQRFALDCSAFARGARAALVDRWPCQQSLRAADQLQLLRGLRLGETLGDALWAQRRELCRAGADPRRWAGWVLLGEQDLLVRVDQPSWLQRWMRARRAQRFGVELP